MPGEDLPCRATSLVRHLADREIVGRLALPAAAAELGISPIIARAPRDVDHAAVCNFPVRDHRQSEVPG